MMCLGGQKLYYLELMVQSTSQLSDPITTGGLLLEPCILVVLLATDDSNISGIATLSIAGVPPCEVNAILILPEHRKQKKDCGFASYILHLGVSQFEWCMSYLNSQPGFSCCQL